MDNPWLQAQQPSAPMPTIERPAWLTEDVQKALNMFHLPHNRDGMLMLHKRAKENLDFYKEQEMAYRKICADLLVPEKIEGMNNVELGNGYVAKVGVKFNYKLDSDNKKIWAALDKVSSIGNQGKFIAERLVSWTPNFLLTEYRQLQEDAKDGSLEAKEMLKVIGDVLVITDAAPTLDIKEPKAKKK